MRITLTTVLFPLALLVATTTASASEIYPGHIQEKLGSECAPSCTLCHDTMKGGAGTVHKPFGLAMRNAGLGIASLPQLDAALLKLQTDGTNSDSEPTPDIQEIQMGDDPNTAGGELCIGPKYGCGASTITRAASKRGLDPAATVAGSLIVGLGLLLLRRRR